MARVCNNSKTTRISFIFVWGLSIKDVRTHWGGWFVQCRHFTNKEGGDSSDANVRALFGAKNIGFFEIMVCPQGGGGVEPVRARGKRINFSRFCADVFMDGPLAIFLQLIDVNCAVNLQQCNRSAQKLCFVLVIATSLHWTC